MLLQMEKLAPIVNKRLRGIHKNAINLRLLITELLDFRKQEQGFMKLKVERVDVISFVKDIYQLFADFAHKRNMEYTFEHAEEEAKLAGHAERVVAEVSQNRLLQTGNTPEEEDNPVQEAVGDVVLQAHQEGSVGETPTKRLLVVLGEVDVVEPIMIQFHFLEA